MIPYLEPTLYTDIQAKRPVCFCRRCGGECYSARVFCPDCEEKL